MPVPSDPDDLIEAIVAGDRRALARAISIVEDDRDGADRLVAAAYSRGGEAGIVGITGAPGSGKSTLVDALVGRLRSAERTVAVVAVDPSSPFTGGAILGDRIRMQRHVSDPGVFVRSMSSRGHLGGLADATSRVLALLDAAGFDPILVETVGVGQSEVEVVDTADTTVVVVAPGWGDGVQAAKAGILEIGDVFCVNKADLPGTEEVVRELTAMLEMGTAEPGWHPPVVTCSAEQGTGIEQVWEAVGEHRRFLEQEGRLAEVRRQRAAAQLRRAVAALFTRQIVRDGLDPALLDQVEQRHLDPWTAAKRLLEGQT